MEFSFPYIFNMDHIELESILASKPTKAIEPNFSLLLILFLIKHWFHGEIHRKSIEMLSYLTFFLFMLNFWLKKRFNLHFKFFLFYFSVGFLDSSKKNRFSLFSYSKKIRIILFWFALLWQLNFRHSFSLLCWKKIFTFLCFSCLSLQVPSCFPSLWISSSSISIEWWCFLHKSIDFVWICR